MTNQTHLFRRLRDGGSDQSTTPRAENLKSLGLSVLRPVIVLRSNLFTQINLPD